MSKRGMSTLIATLILILLCLVALSFVGITIKNSFKEDSNKLNVEQFTLDLEISRVQVLNETDIEVTVKRNSGEGDLSGVAFVMYDKNNSEVVKQNISMKELEEKNFSIILNVVNATLIEKISIAPIFKRRFRKDILGNIQDERKFSSERIGGGSSTPSSSGESSNDLITEEVLENCSDGIQNQDEDEIDCGGPCEDCIIEEKIMGAKSLMLGGVPLIHDQTFLIPESAQVGDTVGDLNLMWVSPAQNIIYSLVDDDHGLFGIERLKGRNTVSNHLLDYEIRFGVKKASFDYDFKKEHSFVVRATDQATGEYQDATITVKLSRKENTVFIDPTWSGCEDGSRECPYDSWIEDISGGIWNWGEGIMEPGMTYVQKRNTVYTFNPTGNQDYYGFTISVNGTPEQHIVIGAYGSGDRPLFDSIYSNSETDTYGGGRGITMRYPLSYYDFYSLAFTNASVGIITSQMGFNQLTYTDLHFFDNHGVGIYSWVTERNTDTPFTQDDVEDRYGKITDCYAEGMGYTKGRDTMPDDNYGFKLAGPQRMDISYTVVRDNKNHGFSNAAASTEFRYSQSYGNRIGVKAHGNDILIDHMLIANNTELGIMNGNYYANYGLDTKRFHMTDSLVYGGERGIDIQENVTDGLIENSVFRNFTNNPDTHQSASAVRIYDTNPYNIDFLPPTNYTFRNNFFLDGEDYAILVGDGSDSPKSILFHNNVVAGFGKSGFHIVNVQGLEIYNNLLYNTGCYYVGGTCHISTDAVYPIEGVTIRNNLLEDEVVDSYMTAPIISNNLVYNDSFFVNPDTLNFTLQGGNFAVDAGTIIPGFHCSTSGAHWRENCVEWFGSAPDIGPFESNY